MHRLQALSSDMHAVVWRRRRPNSPKREPLGRSHACAKVLFSSSWVCRATNRLFLGDFQDHVTSGQRIFFFLLPFHLFLLRSTVSRLSLELCQPIYINISDFLSCLAVARWNVRRRSLWVLLFEFVCFVVFTSACFEYVCVFRDADLDGAGLRSKSFWRHVGLTLFEIVCMLRAPMLIFKLEEKIQTGQFFIFWLSTFAGKLLLRILYFL